MKIYLVGTGPKTRFINKRERIRRIYLMKNCLLSFVLIEGIIQNQLGYKETLECIIHENLLSRGNDNNKC